MELLVDRVVDPDPVLFDPWIQDFFYPGSGMENWDPGSGIKIPDLQHCL
jgi:hypothetical protein